MKIVAKGTVPGGFWGYGRQWPRDVQIEVEVSEAEYAQIAADPHIVSIVVPEKQAQQNRSDYQQHKQQHTQQAHNKGV